MVPESDGPGHDRRDDVLVEHSYDAETPASAAVIQAVCALENVDPTAPTGVGFVLYDHVDPDALDTLLATGEGSGETVVEFELEGYAVRIEDTGRITVADPSDAEDA